MDIKKIANLARLEITDDEASRYEQQLEQILAHVAQLEKVDIEGIEPTAHAMPVFDVVREDVTHGESFTQEEALANAPAVAQGQFKMPKVVE